MLGNGNDNIKEWTIATAMASAIAALFKWGKATISKENEKLTERVEKLESENELLRQRLEEKDNENDALRLENLELRLRQESINESDERGRPQD